MRRLRRLPWQFIFLSLFFFVLFFKLRLVPGGSVSIERAAPTPPRDDVAIPASDFNSYDPTSEPGGVGTVNDFREPRFYSGGTRFLIGSPNTTRYPTPAIFDPYPEYNSKEWSKQWQGTFRPCTGPRGKTLDRTRSEDMMSVYPGTQQGFPRPVFGSQEALGLRSDVCTDRYGRYGPYGFGDNEPEHTGLMKRRNVDWDAVNWGALQSQCYERNAGRYNPAQPDQHYGQHIMSLNSPKPPQPASPPDSLSYKSRSAVILRASEDMKWNPSHQQYMRSLIMELSLHSGSEYQVFFLVDVHNEELDIEHDPEAVQRAMANIPPEFRDMTVLFNTRLMRQWYPRVNEYRAIFQHLQALQVFAQMYPEFDHYWQLEVDGRVMGHTYHFLEQAIEFAKQQPRKHLWERNAYCYAPGAHGTWKEFTQNVAKDLQGKKTVWGPVAVQGIQPQGPSPPVPHPEDDQFEWGVGEEADLITFLPIFNPTQTNWTFPWMLWNLPRDTPRRASPITQWRVSRRLLNAMHQAELDGMAFGSELSAPSWALLHGFKAVHVPHPIYMDGKWSPTELARIFNKGPPENINGEPDSIWNWDLGSIHLWYRMTYMFSTQTAEDLFRRWMGYPVDPILLHQGIRPEYRPGRYWDDGGSVDEPKYGRLCFPPMLLHAIKNPDLPMIPGEAVNTFSLGIESLNWKEWDWMRFPDTPIAPNVAGQQGQ
ncbi:hypothetical protein NUU61_007361, partial [Penicillium alfredii]